MPKVRIHPLLLALIAFMIVQGNWFIFINMFTAVIIHELAHAKVAKSRGYLLETMMLMPYGAVLSGAENIASDDALAVYIAGPVFNGIIALLFIAVWWLVPSAYYATHLFVSSNLTLAIFNLLPLYPLDGSKIVMNLSSNKIIALKIMKIMGIAVSLILFIVFILSVFNRIYITLGIISIFLFAGATTGSNREKYRHIASMSPYRKNISHGLKEERIIISTDTPLYRILKYFKSDSVKIFIVVDKDMKEVVELTERQMQQILENNPVIKHIGSIIKNN